MWRALLGKVCGPLWSTWGAPLGEGKSGVKVGIVNTKVAYRACAGQTPPSEDEHFPGNNRHAGAGVGAVQAGVHTRYEQAHARGHIYAI